MTNISKENDEKKIADTEDWVDPLVAELHAIREAHAKKFNYDLDRIFMDLKEFEKTLSKKPVRRSPKLTGKETA